jgi:DNA-binding transcriptional ArsR family regulator
MSQTTDEVLRGLRAAAEPTRLRMLAVLARGEFSVTDLTRILGQSQPRVSRHLKLLGESGLLERFREQHWIYYRVPADGPGAALVRALLALVDADDPTIALDRERALATLHERTGGGGQSAAGTSPGAADRARQLAAAVSLDFEGPAAEAVLYAGAEPAALLAVIAPMARRVVGLSPSREAVQRARALLHGRGLSHCLLQQGDLRTLPFPAAGFDLVVLDRVLADDDLRPALLREAARVIRPEGRVIVVEDYDGLSERLGGENPLAALRQWITDAGLRCTRLRPVDLSDQHLLLASGTAEPDAVAAA